MRSARERLGGYLYPIRGELAEIYLHHWPDWRVQLSGLQELATASARKLGKDWQVKSFSAGVLIDGKKAWDEGILLIKAPTSSDRFPRAALHTAAQVKVEKELTALEQTIKDHIREIGTSMQPPTLSILEGGYRRDFILEALPPDIEVLRYVFNARGGRLSATEVARLRAWNLQVTQMPLDISIEEFDALAQQIMYAAEDYLAK